jgi:hypothetical protein
MTEKTTEGRVERKDSKHRGSVANAFKIYLTVCYTAGFAALGLCVGDAASFHFIG